jgi:hypothetical protein
MVQVLILRSLGLLKLGLCRNIGIPPVKVCRSNGQGTATAGLIAAAGILETTVLENLLAVKQGMVGFVHTSMAASKLMMSGPPQPSLNRRVMTMPILKLLSHQLVESA